MWNALGIAALGVALASPATAYTVYVSNERGKMLLPCLRLPDFNFSSVTRF